MHLFNNIHLWISNKNGEWHEFPQVAGTKSEDGMSSHKLREPNLRMV